MLSNTNIAIYLQYLIVISAVTSTDVYLGNDWGITQINVKRITYAWSISNYSFNDKSVGEYLESPRFSSNDGDPRNWHLHLYPQGYNSTYVGRVAVFVRLHSEYGAKASFTLALLSQDNREARSFESGLVIFAKGDLRGAYDFIPADILQSRSDELLPDNELTIYVEIVVNDGVTNMSGRCGRPSNRKRARYRDRSRALFADNLATDVTLRIDNQTFKAHRAILATHSAWFFSEFQADPERSEFELTNTRARVFKEMLRFIYTGSVENLEPIAKELLILADAFGIEQLKFMCEESLCRSMNNENALELLTLAELYDAESLERQVTDYVVAHATKVVDSQGFSSLESSQPHPILRVFRELVDRRTA